MNWYLLEDSHGDNISVTYDADDVRRNLCPNWYVERTVSTITSACILSFNGPYRPMLHPAEWLCIARTEEQAISTHSWHYNAVYELRPQRKKSTAMMSYGESFVVYWYCYRQIRPVPIVTESSPTLVSRNRFHLSMPSVTWDTLTNKDKGKLHWIRLLTPCIPIDKNCEWIHMP